MPIRDAKDQAAGFTNHISKIAIIGATGQIGTHLTAALLATGKHTLTAITRPTSTRPLPAGLHVARVDYTSPSSDPALVAALRGQQALIIALSVAAPRDTLPRLVRAAAAAGVSYILPSWFGHDPVNDALCADSLLAARRDEICALVTELGVSRYILLACNFWYEFSLGGGADRFGFDFKERSLVLFDQGEVRINTSTWAQCGRAVAAVLGLKEYPEDEMDEGATVGRFCGEGRGVYVSSFRVTQREMWESVMRVTGTAEKEWKVSYESAEKRWREGRAALEAGDRAAFTKMLYSRMFVPNGKGDGDYESRRGLDNEVLGLPVEDLDEWTAVAVGMGERGEVAGSH
ncbi:NAD(P)-binding protein [Mytilinidion resinicola]|uniref:NAD(P)-binding protein n=1 Tax=Mytilinidion resinicola TaxID=574789 RepID=A0A6A6YS55_9PEZI|nr:NAD(P)-binding protein [Mytilinidion resinicola]KAF2811203.1 NAD(P)-binding protein [Mytilinidion resinicola]